MFSAEELRKIYGRGIPLPSAAHRLATEQWRRAYSYARKRDKAKSGAAMRAAFEQTLQKMPTPPQLPTTATYPPETHPADNYFAPTQTGLRYRRTLASRKPSADAYLRQMYSGIQRAILNGSYISIGYEVPRKASDPPVELPHDLWQNLYFVQWDKTRIAGNGLTFEAVRLVPRTWLTAKEATPSESSEPARQKTGPQSRKAEVIAAYRELDARGTFQPKETYKSVWNKIFEALVERTGDQKGLEYTTVLPFLKDLR